MTPRCELPARLCTSLLAMVGLSCTTHDLPSKSQPPGCAASPAPDHNVPPSFFFRQDDARSIARLIAAYCQGSQTLYGRGINPVIAMARTLAGQEPAALDDPKLDRDLAQLLRRVIYAPAGAPLTLTWLEESLSELILDRELAGGR